MESKNRIILFVIIPTLLKMNYVYGSSWPDPLFTANCWNTL